MARNEITPRRSGEGFQRTVTETPTQFDGINIKRTAYAGGISGKIPEDHQLRKDGFTTSYIEPFTGQYMRLNYLLKDDGSVFGRYVFAPGEDIPSQPVQIGKGRIEKDAEGNPILAVYETVIKPQ